MSLCINRVPLYRIARKIDTRTHLTQFTKRVDMNDKKKSKDRLIPHSCRTGGGGECNASKYSIAVFDMSREPYSAVCHQKQSS